MCRIYLIHILSLLIFSVLSYGADAQEVVINEVMASNEDVFYDEDGDSPDWIELYNAGNNPVNLEGWGISDDTIELNKWEFPEIIIQPAQYLLIFASGKDRREGDYLHTNFKIKAGFDPIVLFNDDGDKMDVYPEGCIPTNKSIGYQPDGSGQKFYFIDPSPGYTNNQNSTTQISIVRDTLIFSHDGGYYPESIQLEISHTSDYTRIFYTSDGSIPDEESSEYSEPILLERRSGDENTISEIRTGPFWEPPGDDVYKVHVIRAIVLSDGCPASNLVTNTYLVDKDIFTRYPSPIISITTDPDNFFGKKKGIYVPGELEKFEGDKNSGNYFESGSEWERTIHLEFFNSDGTLGFEQDAGVRVHGRGSRKASQKTLKLYAREKYGIDVVDYQLFPQKNIDTFKTFLIRTTLGDVSGTYFKDAFCHDLVSELNMDIQSYRPSIVFINGEYWGIHTLRERQDKYYLGGNHNIGPDNLDIIALGYNVEEIVEGDNMDYHALLDFIAENNVRDPIIYELVRSWMDIENYIDYYISQLYFANFDWPDSNIKYWRSRTEDGRWRWFFFDCDWCLIRNSYNHLMEYTIEDERYHHYSESSTFLFRNLLKNNEFRDQFNARFIYLLNSTFEPGNVIRKIDEFKEVYSPMVAEHIRRWNQPRSFDHWLENVEALKYFAFVRPAIMMTQITENLGNPYSVFPNPASGEFFINTNLPEGLEHMIKIFDMTGREVYSELFLTSRDLVSKPILISSWSPGIYQIRLHYGKSIFGHKLVITNR
ncbi:CotH kinase family protein [Bacteroidota bacterium]